MLQDDVIAPRCGAYSEYQSSGEGCLLPAGHEGDHRGTALDLVTNEVIERVAKSNKEADDAD